MSIGYTTEALHALLHKRVPALANDLARRHRHVDHGLATVGTKLHILGSGSQFTALIDGLNDGTEINDWGVLERNHYRLEGSFVCLVLPAVGSAETAIKMLQAIEQFCRAKIFGSPYVQIQVCSPGRFDSRRSAMLGIGFYLGSDKIRKLYPEQMTTTFSDDVSNVRSAHTRGKRLILWDANGELDRGFEHWGRIGKT